jgi:hypothetical protein
MYIAADLVRWDVERNISDHHSGMAPQVGSTHAFFYQSTANLKGAAEYNGQTIKP